MITQERLKQVLLYDPETGIFTWLKSHRNIKPGDRAGCLDDGYIKIKVDREKHRAHKLAWFYVYGEWPDQLDHRDLDKSNNRIQNLRKANHTQNNANKPIQKNNTSGFRGVTFFKPRGRWRVLIRGKYVGSYRTKEAAAAAYARAAKEHFGEFSRVE